MQRLMPALTLTNFFPLLLIIRIFSIYFLRIKSEGNQQMLYNLISNKGIQMCSPQILKQILNNSKIFSS